MKKGDLHVARSELIGLEVDVESAASGSHELRGLVVDETKHTFLVERPSGSETTVPKAGRRFAFRVGNERFVVRGEEIMFRPEDRTKKVRG